MIDFYFKRPVLWDYILGIAIAFSIWLLTGRNVIPLPEADNLFSIISDLSTISLTLAGFILTLLTVLISFKSSAKPKSNIGKTDTVFEIFFYTSLYFDTVKHLKHAIVSLTLIAILGYTLKLSSKAFPTVVLFSYDVFGVVIIFFTLWRCLVILSRIIKLQQQS